MYYQVKNDKKYKYFKYSLFSEIEINEDEFLIAKFGYNYKKIIPYLSSITEHSVHLGNGGLITVGYDASIIQWFNQNGNFVKKINNIGKMGIYSFDIDKLGYIRVYMVR